MSLNTHDTNRRLKAILFADIQGYTALMQKDEKKATDILRRFQSQLQDTISTYHGKVVNFYGDGALCTFDDAVQAVNGAVDLQVNFLKDPVVPVRMGIHSGTVLYEGEKIFGDSVNIASRIESMGVSGSVLVSKNVRDQIKNRPEISLAPMGKFEFKNVDESLQIYALAHDELVVPDREKLKGKLKKKSNNIFTWSLSAIVLILLIAFLIPGGFKKLSSLFSSEDTIDESTQIAINIFDNNTTLEKYDVIGKMATDWITYSIIENEIAPVITYQTMNQYDGITKAGVNLESNLDAFTGDIKLLQGAYYLEDSNLIVQCALLDHKTKRPIHAFEKTVSSINNPLAAIDQMKDRIMGYWVTQEKKGIINKPPIYSAYEYYLEARDHWLGDYAIVDSLLRLAIKTDQDFAAAKLLLTTLNYNHRNYELVDSLVSTMDDQFLLKNPAEANALNYYRALLEGDNKRIFETSKIDYQKAPQDLFVNTDFMVMALEFVNRPDITIKAYHRINNKLLDYSRCRYCVERAEIAAHAYMKKGNPKEAIKILEPVESLTNIRGPREKLVMAYVRTSQFSRLDRLLEQSSRMEMNKNPNYLYFLAAQQSQLYGKQDQQMKYANLAIEKYKNDGARGLKMLGRSYYVSKDYMAAKSIFEEYLDNRPYDLFSLARLAAISFIENDHQKADEYLNSMDQYRREYEFGFSAYLKAIAYTAGEQYEEAFKWLNQAVSEGDRYIFIDYDNEAILKPLHTLPQWNDIMNYWNE